MSAAVIHRGHPLPQQRLQLIEKEERLLLRRHPARIHIRPLVTRQLLQEPLTDRPEKPFHRALVPTNAHPRGLNRDPHLPTRTSQVFPHIDLAVIDHHRLRNDRRRRREDTRGIQRLVLDQHRARDSVRAAPPRRPASPGPPASAETTDTEPTPHRSPSSTSASTANRGCS